MTETISSAARSWLATSDAVLRGLNHEFSNRLSLARLAPQLAAMLTAGDSDLQKIADEAGQSEQLLPLLGLYRLMVFGSNEPAEPMIVTDAVESAVTLFAHHTTFRDLQVRVNAGDAAPPVLMQRNALSQAMLLLISAAASRVAVGEGHAGTIVLDVAGDANAVRISARVDGAGGTPSPGELLEFPALRYLIQDAEGTAETTGNGVAMSIGTLVRLRQREKEG